MSLDFEGSNIDRAALVIMHYQVDVFAILFGEQQSPLLDECNELIRRWRVTGRPLLFPNFFLGEKHEYASKSNRLISSIVPTGRFRNALPMKGLASNRTTCSMLAREPASFMAQPLTPTFGHAG